MKAKSIVSIIASWVVMFLIAIAYAMVFPQKDTMTLLATAYSLMPFVAIAVFTINCIANRKTIRDSKWFCIIVYLILFVWAIVFFKAFFIVYDGGSWVFRWIR